jgi:hypothetical protein
MRRISGQKRSSNKYNFPGCSASGSRAFPATDPGYAKCGPIRSSNAFLDIAPTT